MENYLNKQKNTSIIFDNETLDFFLDEKGFKGMSKEYILDCVFNKEIQSNWIPQIGDVMVGCTGNIFAISGTHDLIESLGGKLYLFGGGICCRDGSSVMDSTSCFTANESGNYYHPIHGLMQNSNHSSIRDFRFVPYPHENIKNI